MPDSSPDRAIDGLARRQHGAFSRRQAVRLGFTAKMIRTRWHAGAWVKLRCSDDVFALPSHPGTWLRQCTAATLSVPGSAVCGPSAAALHGFPDWPRAGIQVVTRHGGTNRSLFASVHQSRTVGRLTVVDGIRVVSEADCIVQLAARLGPVHLGDLIDLAGRTRPNLLAELRDRHVALARSRLPGMDSLEIALEQRGDDHVAPTSVLECLLRRLFASVGSPPVEWEATPPWLERGSQRVDALVPAWRLVVEADGRLAHPRAGLRARQAARRGGPRPRTPHTATHLAPARAPVHVVPERVGRHRQGTVRLRVTTPGRFSPIVGVAPAPR